MPPQPWGLVTWLSSSSLLLVVWLAMSQAQMRTSLTPDGTLGTTVTQTGNLYTITGGTRPGNGPNLFHSFDRFSVGKDVTASFTGPTGIANIVSRVTGGQRSDIDGTLRSKIAGANLFLLNPSGVMFGSNARLDVSGSFHVSTADYLRFADGATFSAHVGGKSTLTVAAPAAFGFLGSTPGPVMMRGVRSGSQRGKPYLWWQGTSRSRGTISRSRRTRSRPWGPRVAGFNWSAWPRRGR